MASLGTMAGEFAAKSGTLQAPAGTSTYDLIFNDVGDRDAGYYKYVWGRRNAFWDRTNTVLPNFHRWEEYLGQVVTAAGKRAMIWQIPVGNQYFRTVNNSNGHYQDNRVEYFMSHTSELASFGVVGLLFGRGNYGSTTQWDEMGDQVTNPAAFCTTDGMGSGEICNDHESVHADDDGGYLRLTAPDGAAVLSVALHAAISASKAGGPPPALRVPGIAVALSKWSPERFSKYGSGGDGCACGGIIRVRCTPGGHVRSLYQPRRSQERDPWPA